MTTICDCGEIPPYITESLFTRYNNQQSVFYGNHNSSLRQQKSDVDVQTAFCHKERKPSNSSYFRLVLITILARMKKTFKKGEIYDYLSNYSPIYGKLYYTV
jgi:hypothetical protein